MADPIAALKIIDHERLVAEALGDEAVYHGRETGGGERTIYLFATTDAPKLLAPWAEKEGHEIEIEMAPDPTWEGLERWSFSRSPSR